MKGRHLAHRADEVRIVASSEQTSGSALSCRVGFYPCESPTNVALPRAIARAPERKPVSAMGGVRADMSGASGIASRKNGVAQRSKLGDAHRWPSCRSQP